MKYSVFVAMIAFLLSTLTVNAVTVCAPGHLFNSETGERCPVVQYNNNTLNFSRVLKTGTVGADVQLLQSFLNSHGYPVGTADGKFGPKTSAGVKYFQSANALASDGVVGPMTLAVVNNIIAVSYTQSNANTPGSSSSNTSGGSTSPNTAANINITTGSSFPSAEVGVNYSTSINATGGDSGYIWSVSAGVLPPGLNLAQASIMCIAAPCYNTTPGIISGAPTNPGVYNFTVNVVSGVQQTLKTFTLEVVSATSNSSNNNLVVCEYARPPAGYHYENMQTNPPCGADLVADQ